MSKIEVDPLTPLDKLPHIETAFAEDPKPFSPVLSRTSSMQIFERSVQEPDCLEGSYTSTPLPAALSRTNSVVSGSPLMRARSSSFALLKSPSVGTPSSQHMPMHVYSSEHYIAPTLDSTTEILFDKSTDLNDVALQYPRRQKSMVEESLACCFDDCGIESTHCHSGAKANTQITVTVGEMLQKGLPNNPKRRPSRVVNAFSFADVIDQERQIPDMEEHLEEEHEIVA